jgi:predicted dehydrogenase
MRGPRTTVVALCENQPQRARELGERYRIPRTYSEYAEVVDQPDIDAVLVALPNHLHAPVAIAALKARKHVLLEAPAALNVKEAAKIIETAKAMKRTVMVAHDLRFHRAVQLARLHLQRGELGEIYHARAYWRRRNHLPKPGSWHAQKQLAGGGCLVELGQPMLDLSLHLLGEFEALSVSASSQTRFGARGLGEPGDAPPLVTRPDAAAAKLFNVEDFASAFIRLKSGRALALDVCWAGHSNPEAPEQGIELFGTCASLSLFPARLYRPGAFGYDGTLLSSSKLPLTEDCAQHFAQCVLENKKPLIAFEEIIAVQRLTDALLIAASTGKETLVKSV